MLAGGVDGIVSFTGSDLIRARARAAALLRVALGERTARAGRRPDAHPERGDGLHEIDLPGTQIQHRGHRLRDRQRRGFQPRRLPVPAHRLRRGVASAGGEQHPLHEPAAGALPAGGEEPSDQAARRRRAHRTRHPRLPAVLCEHCRLYPLRAADYGGYGVGRALLLYEKTARAVARHGTHGPRTAGAHHAVETGLLHQYFARVPHAADADSGTAGPAGCGRSCRGC